MNVPAGVFDRKKLPFILVVFCFLPLFVLSHFLLLAQNGSPIEVYFLFFTYNMSATSLMVYSFIYGLFISGTVFMYHQKNLLDRIAQSEKSCRITKEDKELAERNLNILKDVSKKVLIPYNLNSLVEKELTDITQDMYSSGKLKAGVM